MINCQSNAVKQCKLLKLGLCSGTTSTHFLKLVTRWSWSSCYNSPLIQIFPISYKNLETPQNVATQFRFLRETPPIAMMSIPETIMLSKGIIAKCLSEVQVIMINASLMASYAELQVIIDFPLFFGFLCSFRFAFGSIS